MDTTSTEALDRSDMERLAAGHDAALNCLMERHAQPIFQFLLRMLGNEEDAQDLAQETFVRVYQHRGDFKTGLKFTSWLYTIAGNLARNHYRWKSRHPNVSLESESPATGETVGDVLPCPAASPAESAVTAERSDAVKRAVMCLPEELREALILCEWEDLAVAEAAAILKATHKAVEGRLYRARNLLRETLRKWL